ncbi:MAG: [FeFe] hydrogenase H-cluster radical SAM maturase HydG [Thermodesulfobacteriota bacterium]
MDSFISVEKINTLLKRTRDVPLRDINSIIQKGISLKGLELEEAAALLQCTDKEKVNEIYCAAGSVKESVYGKRLVLFAPLYLSSTCINSCLYCGFRRENRVAERNVLTYEEVALETEVLIRDGHKRLLLVAGEDPARCGIDYIERAIEVVYGTRTEVGGIKRVNVNVAPMSVKGFQRLKSTGIGTYQLFQETYHQPTYRRFHPAGPKSNYITRLFALDRAQEAGIDDVGMGVLFGLYDYRFETLALMCHVRHLEGEFGVGPHTISVPRIEPASNSPISKYPPYKVSDESFKKLVAILRLAVPYTGMILSTREDTIFRDELLNIGISQISANSKTYPGGYSRKDDSGNSSGQFLIGDKRTTSEVINDISRHGFTPSFCTACYRVGRTGREFMDYAKPGQIQRFCLPNSLLTFKEYLLDFGTDNLQKSGETIIREQLASIKDQKIRSATKKKLKEVEEGGRDIYF